MMSNFAVHWKWSRLRHLTANELHEILMVRQRVFIVEQSCAYQDADDLEPSIGRLLTVKAERGGRLATMALQRAIEKCGRSYPGYAIRIAAQTYLERYYRQFGFRAVGAPYEEDGIAHVDMIRPAETVAQQD